MRFRSFDRLPVFEAIARLGSFSAAADELGLTKGAVSYQIKQLEGELGFPLFERLARGTRLTGQGANFLASTEAALRDIERKIEDIRRADDRVLTIGVTTYFASRWLSPRLMEFMRMHPEIRLRIQPMIDLLSGEADEVDLAIRWGRGDWSDVETEPLFACPAWPTGDGAAWQEVQASGLAEAFNRFTLLRDRDDSNAWSHWFDVAGLGYTERADTLVVPDPNVRVQAVIDGQGVALNDSLVDQEIEAGRLFRLSPHELADYGYHLALPTGGPTNPDVETFARWLRQAA